MRKYENANKFKKTGIKPHQILISITSEPDYEMERKILLENVEELNYGEYLLLEGSHCSCYDFDETEWEGIIYTKEELLKLAKADYNKADIFWQEVLKQEDNFDTFMKKGELK